MEVNYCYSCLEPLPEGYRTCPHCGHNNSYRINDESFLREGTVLNSKYLVGPVLGRGGFGVTYIGIELTLQIKVAIKEYFPSGISTRSSNSKTVKISNEKTNTEGFIQGREAFGKEAQNLALFNSPYIAYVREYFLENNTAYIVMDFVNGIDLNAEIKKSGKLDWKRTLDLMMPIMPELNRLHQKNLIHRDIKPANLKITRDENTGKERLVLLDFGAARSYTSVNLTRTYTQIFTPGYAPYEQYLERTHLGPYTDIYSLCATMYTAMTGKKPPSSPDRMINDEIEEDFIQAAPDVPEQIRNVILHGMKQNYQDRPQSMAELYHEFENALENKTGSGSIPLVNAETDEKTLKSPTTKKPFQKNQNPESNSEKQKFSSFQQNAADKTEEYQHSKNIRKTGSSSNKKLILILLIVLLAAAAIGIFAVRPVVTRSHEKATAEFLLTQNADETRTAETRMVISASETANAELISLAQTQAAIISGQIGYPTPTDSAVLIDETPADTQIPVPTNTDTPIPTETFTLIPTDTDVPTSTNTLTPVPTDTNTPTPTDTLTPIQTDTDTPTPTAANTPTATDTPTPTITNTPTATATDMPTPTGTFVPTSTPSPTATATNTPTATATNTPTATATNTPTATATNTPTATATNTPTATATNTPTATATNTPTATATNTPTATATNTPTATATNTPTATATNTPTSTPTNTPTATATNTPTATATNTPTATATNTPTSTATNMPTPMSTNTAFPTATSSPMIIQPGPAVPVSDTGIMNIMTNKGVVNNPKDSGVMLMDYPSRSRGNLVRVILNGNSVAFAGDIRESEGETWVKVIAASGQQGWIQDYYIVISSEIEAGNTFMMGTYEQDNDVSNGPEAVEWNVLTVENGRMLVISTYGLDVKSFENGVQNWLDEDFYNNVFSSSEKERIIPLSVINPANRTDENKLFLMTMAEVDKYFAGNPDRSCTLTAYAAAQSEAAGTADSSTLNWWLRSASGYNSATELLILRPAFWVDISDLAENQSMMIITPTIDPVLTQTPVSVPGKINQFVPGNPNISGGNDEGSSGGGEDYLHFIPW